MCTTNMVTAFEHSSLSNFSLMQSIVVARIIPTLETQLPFVNLQETSRIFCQSIKQKEVPKLHQTDIYKSRV